MSKEVFTFELILHYTPEYEGSVNTLKQEIRRALRVLEAEDMEMELIERETIDPGGEEEG